MNLDSPEDDLAVKDNYASAANIFRLENELGGVSTSILYECLQTRAKAPAQSHAIYKKYSQGVSPTRSKLPSPTRHWQGLTLLQGRMTQTHQYLYRLEIQPRSSKGPYHPDAATIGPLNADADSTHSI